MCAVVQWLRPRSRAGVRVRQRPVVAHAGARMRPSGFRGGGVFPTGKCAIGPPGRTALPRQGAPLIGVLPRSGIGEPRDHKRCISADELRAGPPPLRAVRGWPADMLARHRRQGICRQSSQARETRSAFRRASRDRAIGRRAGAFDSAARRGGRAAARRGRRHPAIRRPAGNQGGRLAQGAPNWAPAPQSPPVARQVRSVDDCSAADLNRATQPQATRNAPPGVPAGASPRAGEVAARHHRCALRCRSDSARTIGR